jgi:molybdopterin-guanine dinucleotide biosynthesis protein A
MSSNKLKQVTAVVLAGGRGSRIGRDKAFIRLSGRPLIEHIASKAAGVFEKVIISGPESLNKMGFAAVPDQHAGAGPIAGILSGLTVSQTPWIMVLPCDSPFVPEKFMRGMAALINDHEVVVPRAGGHYEPLHSLYSRELIPRFKHSISRGESKIISLYEKARLLEVGPEIYGPWDPEEMAFFNINTEDDFRRAEEYLGRRQDTGA